MNETTTSGRYNTNLYFVDKIYYCFDMRTYYNDDMGRQEFNFCFIFI